MREGEHLSGEYCFVLSIIHPWISLKIPLFDIAILFYYFLLQHKAEMNKRSLRLLKKFKLSVFIVCFDINLNSESFLFVRGTLCQML